MSGAITREQLHQQIEHLPDDIVDEIADFVLFVMNRREIAPLYEDWEDRQWQDFAMSQFFREDDEVEYTLEDAQEIYQA